MSRYNQYTRHGKLSFSVSAFFIYEQIQILTIKKPAHPGNKSPERLALNSLFHSPSEERLAFVWFGLTSRWKPFSMMGEAYERTNITRGRTVKTLYFASGFN